MPNVPQLPANPDLLDYLVRIEAIVSKMENRDIGIIAGVPMADYGEYMPLGPQLLILWSKDKTKLLKTSSIRIPRPKPGITGDQLKALGTTFSDGQWWYQKGRWRATVELTSGRKIVTFGASRDIALEMANKCALLTLDTPDTVIVTETISGRGVVAGGGYQVTPVVAYWYDSPTPDEANHYQDVVDLRV